MSPLLQKAKDAPERCSRCLARLFDSLKVRQLPALVEEGLPRAIEAEPDKPSLRRTGIHPVALRTRRRLRAEGHSLHRLDLTRPPLFREERFERGCNHFCYPTVANGAVQGGTNPSSMFGKAQLNQSRWYARERRATVVSELQNRGSQVRALPLLPRFQTLSSRTIYLASQICQWGSGGEASPLTRGPRCMTLGSPLVSPVSAPANPWATATRTTQGRCLRQRRRRRRR
jgi:hypothetical protein